MCEVEKVENIYTLVITKSEMLIQIIFSVILFS